MPHSTDLHPGFNSLSELPQTAHDVDVWTASQQGALVLSAQPADTRS
jgi:hypothetical protein